MDVQKWLDSKMPFHCTCARCLNGRDELIPAITKLVEALQRSQFALERCSQLKSVQRDFLTQDTRKDIRDALAELEKP